MSNKIYSKSSTESFSFRKWVLLRARSKMCVIFWAYVNDEVAQRLASGDKRLRPQDWKSGERRELVNIVAPFGGAEKMVKDLLFGIVATIYAKRDNYRSQLSKN